MLVTEHRKCSSIFPNTLYRNNYTYMNWKLELYKSTTNNDSSLIGRFYTISQK